MVEDLGILKRLREIFKKLNPEIDSSIIDFTAYYDKTLNIKENIEIFQEAYPQFSWNKDIQLGNNLSIRKYKIKTEIQRPTRIFRGIPFYYEGDGPRKKPLGKIDRRYCSEGKRYKPCSKCVEAFDSEATPDGYAKILCSSKQALRIKSLDDILIFLLREQHTTTMNLFYNMMYDVEALFKWDKSIFTQFVDNPEEGVFVAGYKDYLIKYLKGKKLTLQRGEYEDGKWKAKDSASFFDIAQFWVGGLERCASKYLHKEVHELKGDRDKLFSLYPMDLIEEYCMSDATLTKELGELYLSKLAERGLFPKSLLSPAYIAQVEMVQRGLVIPYKAIPGHVQSLYWSAYRGGWFDIYSLGHIKKAYHYDLKSAYSWAFMQIPDYRKGKWVNTERHPPEDQDHGVLRVMIRYDKDKGNNVGVFRKMMLYPIFDCWYLKELTLAEYNQLKDDYEMFVFDSYTWYPDGEIEYPFREYYQELYEAKESAGESGDEAQRNVVKLQANSGYGKLGQVSKTPDKTGRYRAGRLFNPCLFATITALIRMKVREAYKTLRESPITFLTDAIITREPLKLKLGKECGDWSLEAEGELLSAGLGIYQFREKKAKLRGFSKRKIKDGRFAVIKDPKTGKAIPQYVDLWEICDTPKSIVMIPGIRPRHFLECLAEKRFEDIARFMPDDKELCFSNCSKRIFPEGLTGQDLLSGEYYGSARQLSELLILNSIDSKTI